MSWGAVAGAAIGVVGGAIASSSAGDAAQSQSDATTQAANATLQAQREALAAQQPFLNAGYAGVNKLQDLLGLSGNTGAAGYGSLNTQFQFDPSQLTTDPGYQFQLQQGQNALDRKAAAGGGFYSGQALQGASTFNQGLAGTAYNDAYTRQLNAYQTNRANTLNPLQALAGEGQTAANTSSGILTGGANALSGLLTGNANAQGAATIAQGNALTNGLSSGLTAWQRAQYLNQNPTTTSNFSTDVTGGNQAYMYPGDGGYSDIRLKTNVRRVGTTERGNAWYAWDWKTGGSSEGVIAQEVAHIPGAVHADPDGLLMVDYGVV